MAYSCTDFADDILNALNIVVLQEAQDDPGAQAELALAALGRIRGAFQMNIIRDALEGAWTHVNRSIEIAEGDHDPPEDLEAMRAALASIEAAQDEAHKLADLLSECRTAASA